MPTLLQRGHYFLKVDLTRDLSNNFSTNLLSLVRNCMEIPSQSTTHPLFIPTTSKPVLWLLQVRRGPNHSVWNLHSLTDD